MSTKEDEYNDVWEIVKSSVNISKEQFDRMVMDVYTKAQSYLTKRAAALIVARNLGVDTSQVAYPPIIGRLIEVGPIKRSKSPRGETPYVLFSIVNEDDRIACVAFGEHHINMLRESDDKVLRLRKYTKARLRKYTLVKITEESIIEILEDDKLPSILDLKPAWVNNLKELKDRRGTYLVKVLVIDENTTEYFACPICGRGLELYESDWICPEHGEVEPEVKKVWRYLVSDRTGTWPAVFFGEVDKSSLMNRLVILKGYFRNDELQVQRIYWVSEEELIKER